MSYLIISDAPDYKIVKLIETHKNNLLVELYPSQLHKKIKPNQSIYPLETTNIDNFYNQLNEEINNIDVTLIWELIDNEDKLTIKQLADLYFGDKYNQIQITALLFKLFQSHTIFNNNFDGSFNKCSTEEQQRRENNQAKIKAEEELFNQYCEQLTNNEKPNFDIDIIKLLAKPDKKTIAYKALEHVSKSLHISQLELAHKVGLIDKLEDFFIKSFLQDNFPQGINYFTQTPDFIMPDLPINLDLDIFSIDDSTTTEIDDAFSVQTTQNGYIIGIHIAAPALNPHLGEIVATNISTIYYPGNKLTMLDNNVIDYFSLLESKKVPVVSIYFTLDNNLDIIENNSKVEIVKINANLRIEELEQTFNHDNLSLDHGYKYEKELKLLHKFATKLEDKRGKPSTNNLVLDYNFSFENDKIILKSRLRGNPIDKLVSELMILANGSWGRMLTNAFIPAIYRVKQINFPVKMTLTPNSHTSLNIDYYTWSTSPLRRSADYINQRQIISLLLENKAYYNPLDPILLEVVENFDSKYAKYIDFQNKIERYWSLRYLQQENITNIKATIVYKTNAQLEGIPLQIDTNGLIVARPKGSEINLRIFNINLAKLDFEFKIIDNT